MMGRIYYHTSFCSAVNYEIGIVVIQIWYWINFNKTY